MSRRKLETPDPAAAEHLIEEITVDAYGEAEQLWAFHQAFEDAVAVPFNAVVIGEPVSVIGFDCDGNEKRGLTARCRRANGDKYDVAAWEVDCVADPQTSLYLMAYRKWLGITSSSLRGTSSAAASEALIEMVALSVRQKTGCCRMLGGQRIVTLRADESIDAVPGEIITAKPSRPSRRAGRDTLAANVESVRLDIAALGLVPLKLEQRGIWNPQEHYWGDEGEPIEKWAKRIIAWGPRPEFEMEQVLPCADPEDPMDDPITESVDRKESGDRSGARTILMNLCRADLRCLDAHAHLGNLEFDRLPAKAIRHYEAGVRVGELSLGSTFEGLLPWAWIDNRPFLRCLHGYGLCLWRLRKFKQAADVFERMLWLNPSDNQGARFMVDQARARMQWRPDRDA